MSRKEWNHKPDMPIAVSPLWQWPPKPYAVFRWYFDAWFPLTINLGIVALCFLSLNFASPTLADTATPGLWIVEILIRNLVIFSVITHSLHLWFHGHQMQGLEKKYDPRPFPRQGRVFSFGDQLRDNVFWSLASGVTIWSGLEALIWWAMANGYADVITFGANPFWFIALFFLIPVWESFYFYWIHRALHVDALYRFHALHHRNTDVGPWSGLSMHPVEHLMYFGTVLIHFVIPSHPVHVVFHLSYYAITAATTHTGFEGLWIRNRKRLHLGMFHHQLHHRYFECNYGNLDVPWDKLFGSFHDGTDAAKTRMKERLKRRANPS